MAVFVDKGSSRGSEGDLGGNRESRRWPLQTIRLQDFDTVCVSPLLSMVQGCHIITVSLSPVCTTSGNRYIQC